MNNINCFNEKSIDSLTKSLKIFHTLFKHCDCKAEQMEELVFNSIKDDNRNLNWNCYSHSVENSDIFTNSIQISIKSGDIGSNNLMVLSGYRLGRFKGDLNKINNFLVGAIPDFTICNYRYNGFYQFYIIDKKEFIYPNDFNEWKKIGGKRGGEDRYKYSSSNGSIYEIRPSMSWQIWWMFPINLLQIGPCINII